MLNFYSGMPDVMKRLGRFLEATRGNPLALLCDDTQGTQFEDCAEFEDPDESPNDIAQGREHSERPTGAEG